MLKILTGEVYPKKGVYILNNKTIGHTKPYKLFRNVGIVYQEPDRGVFPDLTIEENLILGSKKREIDSSLLESIRDWNYSNL